MRRTRSKSVLKNQKGQGTTEYILILVVVVAIALGMIYQFNDAFRNWMDGYFGEYLACLIETGELPAIGGTGGAPGSCEAQFEPFSLAAGRPALGDGVGEGEGSSSGDSVSQARNRRRSRARGGRGASARGVGAGTFGQRRRARRRLASGRGGGDGSKKTKYTGSSKALNVSSAYGREGSKVKLQKNQQFFDGGVESEKEKKKKLKKRGTLKKIELGRKAKKKLKMPVVKKRQESAPDTEFTIGNFIRVLIIAAIIIALVFLIGGQVLQISKSME